MLRRQTDCTNDRSSAEQYAIRKRLPPGGTASALASITTMLRHCSASNTANNVVLDVASAPPLRVRLTETEVPLQ